MDGHPPVVPRLLSRVDPGRVNHIVGTSASLKGQSRARDPVILLVDQISGSYQGMVQGTLLASFASFALWTRLWLLLMIGLGTYHSSRRSGRDSSRGMALAPLFAF